MLIQEYEGSVCEIKTLKNVFISAGRIEKIGANELDIYDPSGPLPIITYKTPVKIAIFNSTLGFKMLAGQVYSSNRQTIRIVDVVDFLDYEKRRFFRLDIDASAALLLPQGDDLPPKKHQTRITNLSLCGMMFASKLSFKMGDKMSVKIALLKNGEDDLPVVIQRIEDQGDGITLYGAEIVDLDKRIEQNLCAYLFEQQRQQIQRKRANE